MDGANNTRITVGETERIGLTWRKAQSSGHNGQCVEIAGAIGKIAIRDSKDPNGPVLVYAPAEFTAFLNETRNGKFDGLVR